MAGLPMPALRGAISSITCRGTLAGVYSLKLTAPTCVRCNCVICGTAEELLALAAGVCDPLSGPLLIPEVVWPWVCKGLKSKYN